MSENLRTYLSACYAFDAVARRVPADKWDAQSPCSSWTAREVVGHSITVAEMIRAAVGGDGPSEGTEAQKAGDDPLASWSSAFQSLQAQLDQPGSLQQVSQSPFGEMPVDNLMGALFPDPFLHTWDLAQAAGIDHGLDPALARRAQAGLAAMGDAIRGPGRFDDAVEAPADADPVVQLAAFAGRRV